MGRLRRKKGYKRNPAEGPPATPRDRSISDFAAKEPQENLSGSTEGPPQLPIFERFRLSIRSARGSLVTIEID